MKWYPKRFAKNMIILAIVVAIGFGFIALLDRALEVNDCQNNRHAQTFAQCMSERYGN
jgi:hypothetical protein